MAIAVVDPLGSDVWAGSGCWALPGANVSRSQAHCSGVKGVGGSAAGGSPSEAIRERAGRNGIARKRRRKDEGVSSRLRRVNRATLQNERFSLTK